MPARNPSEPPSCLVLFLIWQLSHQRVRQLGRSLRNVEVAIIEPRRQPYTEHHALHYAAPIAECFGDAPDIATILTRLEAGKTEWHRQAEQVMKAASPLALTLTLEGLLAAGRAECWTHALSLEAQICAAAAAAPDCAHGARRLEAAKREALAEAARLERHAAADPDEHGDEDDSSDSSSSDSSPDEGSSSSDTSSDDESVAAGAPKPPPPLRWEHSSLADVSAELVRGYLVGFKS